MNADQNCNRIRRRASAPQSKAVNSTAHCLLIMSMSRAHDVRIRVRHKGFQDISPAADHCNMSITTQPVDNNAKRKTSIPSTARRRLSQLIYHSFFALNRSSNLLPPVPSLTVRFFFFSFLLATPRVVFIEYSSHPAYPTLIKRFQSTCVSTSPWPLPFSAPL